MAHIMSCTGRASIAAAAIVTAVLPVMLHGGDRDAGRSEVILFPIVKDGKWGYMDEKGAVKIEPQYDAAFDFSEGMACVVQYPWRGYIDRTGKMAIEPQFTWAGPFREGLAPVLRHRIFYGRHPNYYGGAAPHGETPDAENSVKKSGLMDSGGNVMPGVPFSTSGVGEGKVILCSRKGTEVYGIDGKKHQHDADRVCQFSDGLAAARKGNLWGYLDHSMKWAIEPRFDNADGFFEGLAAVGKSALSAPQGDRRDKAGRSVAGGKTTWGFIDKTGKQVIDLQFEDVWRFSEGLASVRVGVKWGYIDKTGAVVIKPAYDYAWPFSDGMGRVMMNKKQGFVDRGGKMVIEPKFQPAWEFSRGLARVQLKDSDGYREGYINKRGEYVWEPTK